MHLKTIISALSGLRATPQPTPLPSQRPSLSKRWVAVGIVVAGIIVLIIALVSFQGINAQYQLTVVRQTNVITVHSSLGDTTTTNVVLQDKVAGKYPVGYLAINYPFYNALGSGQLKLVNVVSHTEGFSFQSCDPSLPINAPNTGSQVVTLNFVTPTFGYVGTLDYTVYYEYWSS
jgi:hypothetical protein